MKIVISGGTGYIGNGVLAQCLDNPSITSALILTRRAIKDLDEHPKAKVIIVKDFTSYEEPVIEELRTADAAIWCLGTSHGDERVDIEFPLAFIDIIKTRPVGSAQFRYIQLSGALTEPPPKEGQEPRPLWFYANGRRVRGAMEVKVLETADKSAQSNFTVYLVKPGLVLPNSGTIIQKCIFGDSLSITLNELGAAMIDLALHGNEQRLFSNQELIKHARTVLAKPS